MNKKHIEPEVIKSCAIEFISKKYNPINSDGYFNFYIVRVGIDETHQPNPIYVEELPVHPLLLTSKKKAIEIFLEKCPFKEEYLVKVSFDIENQKLLADVILDYPTRWASN
ncbi:MAG: hypothetical protein IPP06_14350 [Saprospiraceae bacterium]|nr:hypothetical protein [Candidatus Vicinibacter affinis]